MKTLLDQNQLEITLQRLAHQLVEVHLDFSTTAIIGLQPRGVWLSDRIVALLQQITGNHQLAYGRLDTTFYRDDVRQGGAFQEASATEIGFSIENRPVVLIDDVLHTGRTIRAAMDALLAYGRPSYVQLLVLIDRHYSRELPIQPDYTGQVIDTIITQHVRVLWKEKDGEDGVVLLD